MTLFGRAEIISRFRFRDRIHQRDHVHLSSDELDGQCFKSSENLLVVF